MEENLHHDRSEGGQPRTEDAGARGPEPRKRLRIADYVRNGVAEGRLKPGTLLPDRSWFMAKFGATRGTVQRAFDLLAREGFTAAVRRRGTFIVDPPPFTGRFLLMLCGTENQPADSMLGRSLAEAAHLVGERHGVHFDIRHALDEGPDSPAYEAILSDLRRQRYAGVFLRALSSNRGLHTIGNLDHVPASGLFSHDPRAEGSLVRPLVADWPAIFRSSYRRLFEECRDAGRRTVFVLSTARDSDDEASVRRMARQCGLSIGPNGYQTGWIDPGELRQVARLMRLALAPASADLPEAIVLMDDNFVAPVESTLLALYGEAAARRFFIVSCGNRPLLPKTVLPVTFHGFDNERMLDDFVRWANALHAGERSPEPPHLEFFRSGPPQGALRSV